MSITDELRKYAGTIASLAGASTADVKSALEDIADRIDAALADHIPLPKDADGEPIRVGDELEFRNGDRTMRGTVQALSDCWVVFGEGPYYGVKSCHHVKHDSWERIIRDAQGDGILNQIDGRPSDFEALVERCKRLAGEKA